jgi:deoxyribose-phosphate aldolase
MSTLTRAGLARQIDLTLFRPEATRADLEQLCAEARAHNFYGVCVNSSRVELARSFLEETPLKVTALVGFPLGAGDTDAKRYETEVAIDLGAQEIETVINLGRLKDGEHRYVLRELHDLVEAADERPVKLVLESALLTDAELASACEMAVDAGVSFVSTSSGLRPLEAVNEVQRLRKLVGDKLAIKASGIILVAAGAQALIEAGASRLGLPNGVTLVESLPAA